MQNKPARKSAPHQVRIIGGQWKRTPLAVLDAPGLRPTPDRVRETVFNWLTHLFDGRWDDIVCLDVFAGTGALGFEAASRGAARVVMIEENAYAVRQLEAVKERLKAQQVNIIRGDAMSRVAGLPPTSFHVIFLDPPYHREWLPKMLPLCATLLAPGGLVYAESEVPLTSEVLPDWEIVRADKAGIVYFHLLQLGNAQKNQA
ncbi:MAG: 16S rRNA (guanine(966)-N(2))-methyltransferase RsmD [Burkholderiales bacterium]|nr:16S rRNA (guanine(966)-N(2))-methyltransferase RsmD [Burkholderiales bacterium]